MCHSIQEAVILTPVYNLNNRLIQSSTEYYDEGKDIRKNTAKRYYYDENGNTIAEQEKTYTDGRESSNMSISGRIGGSSLKVYKYDAFNRLIQYNDSVSEATYTYGANNLRASKTVNGAETDFVWNGQNLAGEFQNDTVNTYTYDVTGVHMANQNGTIASYIKDYHGNIVAKADTSGNMIDAMIDRRDYDAFGNHRNGAEADPFGYCGEYLDSESGLVYLRNRYYNSSIGRFITEDPVKDGLNWYSYCAGNPVMFVDPLGLGIIDDALNKEYDNILYYEEKMSALDLTQYEDEEFSYRYQDEIEQSRSIINKILNNTTILEVPAFCQHDTENGGQLCWACCEAMIIAYQKGDFIDRTYDIAKEAGDFTSRKWYSCERKFGVEPLFITQGPGILTEQEMRKMIDKGYPIPVRYGRGRNDGHFVVATGYSIIDGETIIVYNDPATGEKHEKTYQQFKYYYDDGRMPWTHTVTSWYKVKE